MKGEGRVREGGRKGGEGKAGKRNNRREKGREKGERGEGEERDRGRTFRMSLRYLLVMYTLHEVSLNSRVG